MALKLNKAQLTTREEIVSRLRLTHDDLNRAIVVFNEALAAARDTIQPQIDAHSEVMQAVREFAGEVMAGAQEAIDAKPEHWLDSVKGQAAISFQQAWEDLDLDANEIDLPEDLEGVDPELADTLANAPVEPE